MLFTMFNFTKAQISVKASSGLSMGTGDFGKDASVGFNYLLNGTYKLSDQLDVGLEYSSALIVAGEGEGLDVSATVVTGFAAKGYYYLTKTKVKPYGALALGFYTTDFGEVSSSNVAGSVTTDIDNQTNFGFAPELGLKMGWFVISATYVYAGDIDVIGGGLGISYINYNIGISKSF